MKAAALLARIIFVFFVVFSAPTGAAVICNSTATNCRFFVNDAGALVDSASGKTLAQSLGNVGMMADVSVYRYGEQYALIRESNLSSHGIIAIPVSESGGKVGFSSVYYISIDMIASSGRRQAKWSGKKVVTKFTEIDDGTWDVSNNLLKDSVIKKTKASGFPEMEISISTDKSLGEHCFAPFREGDDNFPIEFIACRGINNLIPEGENEFSGVVNHAIPIDVIIIKQGGSLIGKYRYLRRKNGWIGLRGAINQGGGINIQELDSSTGSIAASFSGAVGEGIISGDWISADGKRKLPFALYLQGFAGD
jgi:hypothetical protein